MADSSPPYTARRQPRLTGSWSLWCTATVPDPTTPDAGPTTNALIIASARVRRLSAELTTAVAERNDLMVQRREEGASLATIGREADLTKPAIAKALANASRVPA